MAHSLNVITNIADTTTYVALKHSIGIVGYDTDVYLPKSGKYDPKNRTGSIYNNKDHEYQYDDTPSFQARLAYEDPLSTPIINGRHIMVDEANYAYTLYGVYCPTPIQLYSKLVVNYGNKLLNYFVKSITSIRNPNAKNNNTNTLVKLELVVHV